MRTSNSPWLLGFGLSLLVILVFAFPSATLTQDVDVDDETCLGCHEDLNLSLKATAHRLSSEIEKPATTVTCVSCHAGAAAHIDDPTPDNIVNPANQIGLDIIKNCTQCHEGHSALDDYGYDAHSIAELSCTSCHKVHTTDAKLLLDEDAEFCFACHESTRDEFRRRSNHPVLQKAMTCLDCHSFVMRDDQAIIYDLVQHCRDCHPEQGGPFLYEHQAVNAYSAQSGTGCMDCHHPHGGPNDRLLRQAGNQNCTGCHFPARHGIAHGGSFADQACQYCHIDTHGSFVSNFYLDPDLPAKYGIDCYESGCHTLVR
jgi:DmsE family decaheme c-type cytochrome